MEGELKVYPNKWKLFAYMFPLILTLFLLMGLFFIDPDLLITPQDWVYKVSSYPVTAQVEVALPEALDSQKEEANDGLLLFISLFLLSILLEAFLFLIEIIIFFKSFVRFFRGGPEITISNAGIAHYSNLFSWDKIEKFSIDSKFSYMFFLGPWWFKKRFYSLNVISKDGSRVAKITLRNIDQPINSIFGSIKNYKEVDLNF